MDHLIFVRKAYIPNFRPLVPFLHVKKFVVGGWVLKWILVLSLDPSLTTEVLNKFAKNACKRKFRTLTFNYTLILVPLMSAWLNFHIQEVPFVNKCGEKVVNKKEGKET